MPTTVDCSCGASYRLPDAPGWRRLVCERCGSEHGVPPAGPSGIPVTGPPREEGEGGPVCPVVDEGEALVRCRVCGALLDVGGLEVGLQVSCEGCGSAGTIPDAPAAGGPGGPDGSADEGQGPDEPLGLVDSLTCGGCGTLWTRPELEEAADRTGASGACPRCGHDLDELPERADAGREEAGDRPTWAPRDGGRSGPSRPGGEPPIRTWSDDREPEGIPLGPYDLTREVGRGGMGVVYEARHRPTGELRAVKVLHGTGSERLLGRFRREASVLESLDHPAIVGVHEAGTVEGRAFIAMEFLEGWTLKQVVEEGLEPETAIDLVAQVAEGMAHAHEAGVLHRDLKPSNVIVDREGRARVTDFGLARAPDLDDRLTRTGTILGTPYYMSPEQLSGVHHGLDGRSDVYALGVVLYEALTGRLPHEARSPVQLARRIEEEEPAPPSRWLEGPDRFLADIDDLVLRTLAADRRDRPAGAGAFARELRELLTEEEADRPGPEELVRAHPRIAAGLAGLVAILLFAGLLAPDGSDAPAGAGPGEEGTEGFAPSADLRRALQERDPGRRVELLEELAAAHPADGSVRDALAEARRDRERVASRERARAESDPLRRVAILAEHVRRYPDDEEARRVLDERRPWSRVGPGRPAPRRHPALVHDPARDEVLLFGGRGREARADTWALRERTWHRLHPGTVPPARWQHAMARDPVRQRVILFGGRTREGPLDDTWAWDGETWRRRETAIHPPGRSLHAMAWDPAREVIVLHGGTDGSRPLDDTWEWDGRSWRRRSAGTHPPARAGHALRADPAGGGLLLVGGRAGETWRRDTWRWTGETWEELDPEGAAPPPRVLAALYRDPGLDRLLLAAGRGPGDAFHRDVWGWDGRRWREVEPAESPPATGLAAAARAGGGADAFGTGGGSGETWRARGASWSRLSFPEGPGHRVSGRLARDPRRQALLLFGGLDADAEPAGGTWIWDGVRWSDVTPEGASPPLRRRHVLCRDPDRGEVLLFGGLVGPDPDGEPAGDTWTWDGSGWSERWPSRSPSPRHGAAACPDREGGGVLVFGGGDGDRLLAGTWRWDGTTWEELDPSRSPPARSGAAMARDPVREVVVLFGGRDGEGPLDDTWIWDGETWREREPVRRPPSRSRHVLVWDPRSETVLLHGGRGERGPLEGTWAWDGDDWVRRRPVRGPGPIEGHAAAWDPVREAVVLVGGTDGWAVREDVWERGPLR